MDNSIKRIKDYIAIYELNVIKLDSLESKSISLCTCTSCLLNKLLELSKNKELSKKIIISDIIPILQSIIDDLDKIKPINIETIKIVIHFIDGIDKQNNEYNEKFSNLNSSILIFEDKISDIDKKYTDILKKFNTKNKDIEKLVNKNKEIETIIQDIKLSNKKIIDSLFLKYNETNSNIKNIISQNEINNNQLLYNIDKINKINQDNTLKIEQLINKITSNDINYNELKIKLESSELTNNELKIKIEELVNRIELTENKNKELDSRIDLGERILKEIVLSK